MTKYDCTPEMFEAVEDSEIWGKMPPLTQENLKTIRDRQDEEITRLYGKYRLGGASPQKTYLQIAQRYTDCDVSYAKVGDE